MIYIYIYIYIFFFFYYLFIYFIYLFIYFLFFIFILFNQFGKKIKLLFCVFNKTIFRNIHVGIAGPKELSNQKVSSKKSIMKMFIVWEVTQFFCMRRGTETWGGGGGDLMIGRVYVHRGQTSVVIWAIILLKVRF